MGFFRNWECRVVRDSGSEFWQLPIDKQEGLQMSFLYWYLELGMALPIEIMLIGGGLVPKLVK